MQWLVLPRVKYIVSQLLFLVFLSGRRYCISFCRPYSLYEVFTLYAFISHLFLRQHKAVAAAVHHNACQEYEIDTTKQAWCHSPKAVTEADTNQ